MTNIDILKLVIGIMLKYGAIEETKTPQDMNNHTLTAIIQAIEMFEYNIMFLINSILGLSVCVAFGLLSYFTGSIHKSIRYGIWSLLGYICYCMLKTYTQHTKMLERLYSYDNDNNSDTHSDLLFHYLLVFVSTTVVYAIILYLYYGNSSRVSFILNEIRSAWICVVSDLYTILPTLIACVRLDVPCILLFLLLTILYHLCPILCSLFVPIISLMHSLYLFDSTYPYVYISQ